MREKFMQIFPVCCFSRGQNMRYICMQSGFSFNPLDWRGEGKEEDS